MRISLLLAVAPLLVQAAVELQLQTNETFMATWHERTVITASRPSAAAQGAGVTEVFDPNSRQMLRIPISHTEAALTVFNKQRQRVHLGAVKTEVSKVGKGLVYTDRFANADAYWRVALQPIDDNGLDVLIDIHVAENYWLQRFNLKLLTLAITNGIGDSGALRQRLNRQPRPDPLPPMRGDLSISYPSGPECYVPAAVLQDAALLFGLTQLDVHTRWRADRNRLDLLSRPEGTILALQSGWADNASFDKFYKNTFHAHYRIRFDTPRKPGASGYISLVDAKDLWIDYMKELNREMPALQQPALNPAKNNVAILHYMLSEEMYMTPENPQGYLMMHPNWKEDKWEFGMLKPGMSNEEVKQRCGFGEENYGRPVKWVKASAERLVREALETKAQAIITMKTGTSPHPINYIAETQLFNPLLEERIPVEGPVRNWDYAIGDVVFYDADGKIIGTDTQVAVQAADKDRLIPYNRGDLSRQELFLHERRASTDFQRYQGKFNLGPKHDHTLRNVAGFRTITPAHALIGKKIGETASIRLAPISWHPELRDVVFRMEITLRSVEREAIDVWAKTIIDAGIELGFLIREDMSVGLPWRQFNYGFDYSNEWQYQVIKQRIQWHRARFGTACRWFYLDVFGDWTPSFIATALRADFPDCFFFFEHPNDVDERVVNGWLWFGEKTPLQRYVAPQSLCMVGYERMLVWNEAKDRAMVKKFFNQPGYIIHTHRGARRLINLATENPPKPLTP